MNAHQFNDLMIMLGLILSMLIVIAVMLAFSVSMWKNRQG